MAPLLATVLEQLSNGGGAKSVTVESVGEEVEELGRQYPIRIPAYFGLIIRCVTINEFPVLDTSGQQLPPCSFLLMGLIDSRTTAWLTALGMVCGFGRVFDNQVSRSAKRCTGSRCSNKWCLSRPTAPAAVLKSQLMCCRDRCLSCPSIGGERVLQHIVVEGVTGLR